MNTHDIPMILFTVVTQMCVGAFLALGVVQVVAASRRHSDEIVERVSRPVLYAIGPAMVFGLIVSMFHMGYPLNTLNVIRHPQSSWLSREILFGCGFAALGFVYAVVAWFRLVSFRTRRVLAAITAVVGAGLVVCESMIYFSVVTIPAWHSWWVPFSFSMTTVILGSLSVSCALMVTAMVRRRNELSGLPVRPARGVGQAQGGFIQRRIKGEIEAINAPTGADEWGLTTRIIQWCAVAAAAAATATLIGYPIFSSALGADGLPAAQQAAAVFTGPGYIVRLVLLGAVALLLGFFVYRTAARTPREHPQGLALTISIVFVLAGAGELVGRALHYATLFHVGI